MQWGLFYSYKFVIKSRNKVLKLGKSPDCSRLQSSPNIQSGKYNEMDPILIGTAVSVVSYTTDSTALVPSRNVCREGTSAIKSV